MRQPTGGLVEMLHETFLLINRAAERGGQGGGQFAQGLQLQGDPNLRISLKLS